MKFDIKQLVVFIEVVQQAGFSKAAKVLGVAQGSVSERIASLEKAVGAKLLHRLGRKVELTSTGAFLFRRAEELVALKRKTDRELGALLGLDQGEIRIGGSTAPGEYLLPRWMGGFAALHPGVRLILEIGDSSEIIEKIRSGALELGVVGKRESEPNLIQKKIGSDRITLVVGPKHKWANRRGPVDVDLLAEAKWVVREPGSATRTAAERMLGQKRRDEPTRKNVIAELDSVTAVKEAVIANLGVALVSELTVSREIAAGTLIKVRVKGFEAPRHFYLVRDQRRVMGPASDAFWKFVLKESKAGK